MSNQSLINLFIILAEASPDMIFINKGGRVVYVNRRCEEIMGYKREEFYSKDFDFMNIIAPEYHDRVRENFKIHMSGKDIPPYEYKLITKDGQEIYAIHHTKLIEYEGGRAILGIVSDITAQRELIKSEERLKTIFNNSPDVMMIVSPSGVIRSANRTTLRVLGYFEDTLVGKPFSILLNTATNLSFDDLTRDVRVQKTMFESIEFLRADGSICPMDMTMNLIPWDEGMMVLVNLRDVTERVNAERALKRRDAILESVRYAAEEFLKSGSWNRNIGEILRQLGTASDVSRVYIFKKHYSDDGKILCSQLFEWTAEGVEPQIYNPELQNIPVEERGFSRWLKRMQEGEPVYGHIKDFPEEEQGLLRSQQIKSILAVPIFINNELWGLIGFDECRYEREWSGAEIDALRAAADIIGVAIYRSGIEESLQRRLEELERFRKATIQREFRIRELQNRVRELERELERLRSGRHGI